VIGDAGMTRSDFIGFVSNPRVYGGGIVIIIRALPWGQV